MIDDEKKDSHCATLFLSEGISPETKPNQMKTIADHIALATLALDLLAQGEDFKECLAHAGLTHESTGFSPAIENPTDAKITLLEFKSVHQAIMINELSK